MNDEAMRVEQGSPDDESDVADEKLPSDEDEDAAPPPADDSATPVAPDGEEVGQ